MINCLVRVLLYQLMSDEVQYKTGNTLHQLPASCELSPSSLRGLRGQEDRRTGHWRLQMLDTCSFMCGLMEQPQRSREDMRADIGNQEGRKERRNNRRTQHADDTVGKQG